MLCLGWRLNSHGWYVSVKHKVERSHFCGGMHLNVIREDYYRRIQIPICLVITYLGSEPAASVRLYLSACPLDFGFYVVVSTFRTPSAVHDVCRNLLENGGPLSVSTDREGP